MKKYAPSCWGKTPAVCKLLFGEHYMPTSAEGELPASKVGAVLAIADKLDTILSFFSVGLIPSGSNDPYALRRATQGVVRILDAFGWHIAMDELIDSLYALTFDSLTYENKAEVMDFIKARVDKMMGATPKTSRKPFLQDQTLLWWICWKRQVLS